MKSLVRLTEGYASLCKEVQGTGGRQRSSPRSWVRLAERPDPRQGTAVSQGSYGKPEDVSAEVTQAVHIRPKVTDVYYVGLFESCIHISVRKGGTAARRPSLG